jgi:hypothetical protein
MRPGLLLWWISSLAAQRRSAKSTAWSEDYNFLLEVFSAGPMTRWKAPSIHLAISIVIAGTALGVMLAMWYAQPFLTWQAAVACCSSWSVSM